MDTTQKRSQRDRSVAGQLGFLAETSRLLATSLDYEETLARVAGMALPHLGGWCIVDLVGPGDVMRRIAIIHKDPDKQAIARKLAAGWPPERDDPIGVPRAVRTRRSEVIEDVPDEMLRQAARADDNYDTLKQLGIGSLIVIPLIAREQVLGAITYVSDSAYPGYTSLDLELAEDLAARCAMAIHNAQLYHEARQARIEAEEASRARSEFLAMVSHEVRTPVNAILGYADLLETGIAGPLTPNQCTYLERIRAGNRHLLGLINDMLDFSRIEAERLPLQLEEADAASAVDAALDLVRPQTEGRALSLSARCEGACDVRFIADVDRVRQILVNLLSNAVKFTPDGGRVTITCGRPEEPPPEVVSESSLLAWIRVEDTGVGIAPEVLPRLFQPFTQGETGYTRGREGTGLGLAISRRLARMMDGDIAVESRPGEGSTFTLWLPAPGAESARAETVHAATNNGGYDRVHGVAELGRRMLADVDAIAKDYVQRMRATPLMPNMAMLSDDVLKDHTASLIADLLQSLVLLEDRGDDPAELLRDGSAIQRTIADRHGLQRHRIGWTAEALDQEFDLLAAALEQAAHASAAGIENAQPMRAMELLTGFLEHVRRGSLRAYRMAGRAAIR